MKLTESFLVEEFEKSSTADKYRIDNHIPNNLMKNVFELAKVLLVIRNAWGKPIIINSGYRCPVLNLKVGGSKNSDHKWAAAADIHTSSNTKQDNKKLFDLICKLAKNGKIHCRQIIDEHNYSWIHVSINNSVNAVKNNQILHL